MELNWFNPEEAKNFLKLALKQKLLIKKDDLIQPNFDYNKIVVPVGFHPTKSIFDEKDVEKQENKEENILSQIAKRIVEKTNLKEEDVIEKIKDISKEKNINLEVAALLIGKEHEITLEDFFEEVEKTIF
jgi:hypothetical protein